MTAAASCEGLMLQAPVSNGLGLGWRIQVCALSELCALGSTADRAYKSLGSWVAPTRESTAVRSAG